MEVELERCHVAGRFVALIIILTALAGCSSDWHVWSPDRPENLTADYHRDVFGQWGVYLQWVHTNGSEDIGFTVYRNGEEIAVVEKTIAGVPDVPVRIVASLRSACHAAAAAARAQGLKTRAVRARIDGDAAELGARFVASLARHPAGIVQVRGGESTVRLPAQPGRGGRNQHLALAAALELERRGLHEASLLAAGTDGIDGASDDAGALVDDETCQRGRDAGRDPGVSLACADSGTFLEAAGDLLHTGPTLTNVGDLVLGLRLGGRR